MNSWGPGIDRECIEVANIMCTKEAIQHVEGHADLRSARSIALRLGWRPSDRSPRKGSACSRVRMLIQVQSDHEGMAACNRAACPRRSNAAPEQSETS